MINNLKYILLSFVGVCSENFPVSKDFESVDFPEPSTPNIITFLIFYIANIILFIFFN